MINRCKPKSCIHIDIGHFVYGKTNRKTASAMTQIEKQLLLGDFCARLPYGVKFNYGDNDGCDYKLETISLVALNNSFPIEDCKPYLRSRSSMTDKEKKEEPDGTSFDGFMCTDEADNYVDWLNEHHFDYRGLIERGYALEAPEGMYEIE